MCCNTEGRDNPLERLCPLSSLKATQTGERLDRFELIAELASGGMATVFLARLEGVAGFQRLYAIKRLHPHLAHEAEFVDMFLDEARLAARIHHPNVVPILEVGTSADGYYLVMEYIEGDTAARLLARSGHAGGRLPVPTALRIGLDSLAGLHAAHELGDDDGNPLHIVHRDVSPQNILVGVDGTSRITDFGVAHAATRLSSTRTGQLKGKLAYMAPEQARGAPVDRRADVWAMGVVLWEMLAGKRLFKGSNDAETLHRILFAPIPTLRGSGIDVPLPLDEACMKALEREPADRYASAAEFGDAVERIARSFGMLATTRDLATFVDGAIGAEISQQREVVRMWLARSEPSRNERVMIPSGPRRSSPASHDVTMSAPSDRPPANHSQPAQVSSVSSAVLEVAGDAGRAGDTGSGLRTGDTPLPAFRGNNRRLMGVLAVALSAAGVLALFVAWPRTPVHPRSLAGTPFTAAPQADPTPPPVAQAPTTPPVVTPVPPPAVAASPPSTVASTVVPPRAAGAPNGVPARPQPKPKPPGPAVEAPDDLSHNPYR